MGLLKSIFEVVSKGMPDEAESVAALGLPLCYDAGLLKYSSRYECYLLLGANKEKATSDIMKLNLFLLKAKKLVKSFPMNYFVDGHIEYCEPKINAHHPFCRLMIIPSTKTGKPPKYPLELFADISDNLFARIFYLQTGEIGKAEIISWSDRCYELSLAIINGVLDIKTIYVTNPKTHEKQKMYFIPPKKGEK